MDIPKQTLIEYIIKEHQKYEGKNGRLKKFLQKSSAPFQFLGEANEFILNLLLPRPAFISSMEVKLNDVDEIIITSHQLLARKQLRAQQTTALKIQFDQVLSCEQIQFKLINHTLKASTIHYLILKGHLDDKIQQRKVTNVIEFDQVFKVKKNTMNQKEREIFQTREKTSNKKKQKIYLNLEKKSSEQDQLRQALEASKKEYEKQKWKETRIKQEIKVDKIDEKKLVIPQDENKIMTDQIQNVSSELVKVFSHVTDEWLKQQKRFESKLNVRSEHSISNLVKTKILRGMKFWVSLEGYLQTSCINRLRILGGEILKEPIENCFAVSNKIKQNTRVKGIKWIKPSYIHHCEETKSKLDWKDYIIRS